MVPLCAQCGAPLTPADLGFTQCLNCHWQQVFDYAPDGPHMGELRLLLRSISPTRGRDSGGRIWELTVGDGAVWCTLCGQALATGWMQGQLGWIHTYVCADHVDIR